MAEPLVSNDLWDAVAPLLPRHRARPSKRGRPPVDDWACLTGIVFVLRSGIPWEMLPQEMPLRLRRHLLAAATVLAAPRRLEETPACPPPTSWTGEGHRLGALLRGQPELPRCRFWGVLTGKNPTDRAKKGTKRPMFVDGKGTPLAVRITGANRNESLEAMNLVDDIPPIRGRRGRPRRKPKALYGDRQYGTPRNHQCLKERRIEDYLAQQRTPHGSGLGKVRWVVESTLSWVGQARRLKIRYERLPAMHRAFHYLRLAQICCKVLQRDF